MASLRTRPDGSPIRAPVTGLKAIRDVRPVESIVVLVLLVLPVLRFAVPPLIGGSPVMPGDDFDQNFPLRVLVGHQLRDGVLPLLDPFNWSGSPLLGGWNAGAAYPATWLFAILPANPAWVIGELLTYWVAGLGLYAFLRAQSLCAVPAGLGSAAFVFGGSFAIQVEHFGLVAGVSWIPVCLLAMYKLSTSDRPMRWVLLLGVSLGLCVLAGEPRAIAIAVIVLAGYGVWRLVHEPRRRLRLALLTGCGAALGLLLSAVQWAPGMLVVADSQREGGGYRLYGAGSMAWSHLPLAIEPMLLGGSGSAGLPGYAGGYSLTEIASYVGLLPLVAAGAFVRRWRRPLPEWAGWVLLAVLGGLLALGSTTPLGHVWHLIPFFGGQRLQSRNIMITDLALAILLAYWAQEWLDRPRRRTGMFVPLGIALGLGIAALAAGPDLARHLGAQKGVQKGVQSAAGIRDLDPAFALFVALAVATAVLLAFGHRLSRRARAGGLVAVLACDLAAYAVMVVQPGGGSASASGGASVQTPGRSVQTLPLSFDAGKIGRDGRFLIYGPDGIGSRSVGGVGDPDLNVIARTYSVQGYTAAVDALYASTTGTHGVLAGGQHTASLWALESGVLDQLSAKYLITQPNRLLSVAATDKAAERHVLRTVDVGEQQTWNFGEILRLSAVSVPVTTDSSRVRLGLRMPGGAIRWLHPQNAGGFLSAHLPAGTAAAALVLRPADQTVTVAAPSLRLSDGRGFVADGDLQSVIDTGDWRYAGNLDGYAVFRNPHASPPLSVRAGDGATVRRTAGDPLAPEAAAVSSPHGTRVIRSVTALPGWTARWVPSTPAGGSPRTLAVHTHGLVQAVQVPAGTGTLRWHYRTPGFLAGAILTLVGVGVLVGSGLWTLLRRRA